MGFWRHKQTLLQCINQPAGHWHGHMEPPLYIEAWKDAVALQKLLCCYSSRRKLPTINIQKTFIHEIQYHFFMSDWGCHSYYNIICVFTDSIRILSPDHAFKPELRWFPPAYSSYECNQHPATANFSTSSGTCKHLLSVFKENTSFTRQINRYALTNNVTALTPPTPPKHNRSHLLLQ